MNKFLLLALAVLSSFSRIAAQCEPQLLDCDAAVQACDFSNNDPQYWNEIYWWDNAIQTHDLAEGKIDLNLSVRDTCPGGFTVRCLLFLDTDANGTRETVVDSDNPPAAGMVNFGNAGNPNYSGGTPQAFDQRPVPDNLKWRFALKTTQVGDSSNYRFQWVNDSLPTAFEQPALPYGYHKVTWVVTNNVGIAQTCEKVVSAKDCKAPTVVCLNGLSVNVMPTGMISLWASDFLQYMEDNVTPSNLIKLGIRKAGTGTGFPVDAFGNPISNLIFDCDELGTQGVELWAIDLEGNADYCETYVIVQDNLNVCVNHPPLVMDFCAKTYCDSGALEEALFDLDVVCDSLPMHYFELSDGNGCFDPAPWLQGDCTEFTVTPSYEGNPLNGVTTFDLLLINQHIDWDLPFSNPYQWVAADANNDQIVDSLDIDECKKLILGIYTQLPNNKSWRFVDKSYVFPTPNPLSAPFPESITVDFNDPMTESGDFVAIKICDVTCNAITDFYDLAPENEHLIGTPQPNPTNESAMLPLQLVSAETVHLEVLDFSGRMLFQNEMRLPEGPALLEIPAAAMPVAGVYVWRVRAGDVAKSGNIVRY